MAYGALQKGLSPSIVEGCLVWPVERLGSSVNLGPRFCLFPSPQDASSPIWIPERLVVGPAVKEAQEENEPGTIDAEPSMSGDSVPNPDTGARQ